MKITGLAALALAIAAPALAQTSPNSARAMSERPTVRT